LAPPSRGSQSRPPHHHYLPSLLLLGGFPPSSHNSHLFIVVISIIAIIMKVLIIVVPLLLLSSATQAFLQEFIPKVPVTTTPFNKKLTTPNPILRPTTDALVGQELEVRLEIVGGDKNSAQAKMSIQQLLLRLDETEHHPTTKTKTTSSTNKKTTATTGGAKAAVVIPLITTGRSDIVHSLTVQKMGSFINHAGLQMVNIDIDTAVWELIWDSPESPAGTLVLGLDVQHDATRNDATLKKGHIFISFPVWTKDGITEYQQRKAEVEEAAGVHLAERDIQIQKYKDATNIIAKLFHYRNAAAAVERYSMYPTRAVASIPDNDDLIPLIADGSLLLTKTGTIWRQPEHKNVFMVNTRPVAEGTASIKVKVVVPTTVTTPMSKPPLVAMVL
jgi:hypothetical protein